MKLANPVFAARCFNQGIWERFKGRELDFERPVEVYRHIGKGKNGEVWYSVRQDGIVKVRARCVLLVNVTLHVSEAGRQRVLRDLVKNVHAFIRGRVARSAFGVNGYGMGEFLAGRATYNPYKFETFVTLATDPPRPLTEAKAVLLNDRGMTYSQGF